MAKQTLVLINSFGTDSILLKGLIDYLNEFFDVDFVDLPGFIHTVPALDQITLSGYVKFAEDYLDKASYKNYILGGISFGYLIVSKMKPDSNCTAMMAIEPLLDSRSLRVGKISKIMTRSGIFLITQLNLQRFIWKHPSLLRKVYAITRKEAAITLKEVDPKTFFKTAFLLLGNVPKSQLPNKPQVLFVNPNDDTLDTAYIKSRFQHEVKNLFVILESVDHYPKDLSEQYFEQKIPKGIMKNMALWLEQFNSAA